MIKTGSTVRPRMSEVRQQISKLLFGKKRKSWNAGLLYWSCTSLMLHHCFFRSLQMDVPSFHVQVPAVSVCLSCILYLPVSCIFYFDFYITVGVFPVKFFFKSFMRRSDRCIDDIFKLTRLLLRLAILLTVRIIIQYY